MHGAVSRALAAVRHSVRTALFSRTVAMRNRRAIVSFTFDDFPQSAVLNGARLLENHGARGTFYLTGSYCGRVVDNVPQYGAEDLAVLAQAGHEIGCHTFSHPRVSALSSGCAEQRDKTQRGLSGSSSTRPPTSDVCLSLWRRFVYRNHALAIEVCLLSQQRAWLQ